MAALGVAGAAAGIKFATNSAAHAQQPTPNGYSQTDVLNFLLNIKYLKATYYSYLTTGADLPAYVTSGTGFVEDVPGTTYTANKITLTSSSSTTFTGNVVVAAAKLTVANGVTQPMIDMLYEMYYDELQQVIDLRNLIGPTVVISRPRLNLLGTGVPSTTGTFVNTLPGPTALATARMLEDVSATAFAGALAYLSGANLALATQILASDGYHSGAIRLACIQAQAPYQSSQSITPFIANMVSTSNTPGVDYKIIYPASGVPALPAVGSLLTGYGISKGTTVTSVNPLTSTPITVTGFIDRTKGIIYKITNVSDLTGVQVGQYITGTGLAGGAFINAHDDPTTVKNVGGTNYTITMSATTSAASTTVAATGTYKSGDKVIDNVSSITNVLPNAVITGTGLGTTALPTYVTGTTSIPSASPTGSPTYQIFLSQAATGTSVTTSTFTGTLVAGSNTITNVSALTNIVTGTVVGTATPQKITLTTANGGSLGTGVPLVAATTDTLTATATIGGVNTVTLTNPAFKGTTTTPLVLSGIVTTGSTVITFVPTITGVAVGQPISCTGLPAGSTVVSTSTSLAGDTTITTSGTAFASTNVVVTGTVTPGTLTIKNISTPLPAAIATTALATGLPISGVGIPSFKDSSTNVPTTITAVDPINGVITINGTAAGGPTGITTAGSNTITSVSSITGLAVGQTIGGMSIPAGTTITAIGTTSPYTITMSQNAPTTEVGFLTVVASITIGIRTPVTTYPASSFSVSLGTAAVTISTPVTLTIPTASVTMSSPPTVSGPNMVNAVNADPMDVSPVDPGTTALAAKGPAAAAAPTGALDGVTPAVYQGFFNTAGAATSGYGAPSGFAFARTFSQVLQCLYNGTTTTTTQVTSGGFFPSGVGGNITAV